MILRHTDCFVSGPLHFIVDDPGRQTIGSFHPITTGEWSEGAYLGNGFGELMNKAKEGDDEAIRDGILGKDIVGIVPEGVFPRYCESLFPNEMIVDFTNLDLEDEENAVFMAKAVFDDPDPIALEE